MCDKVKNLGTFLKQLPKLESKMRGDLFYRGHGDIQFKLTPSVLRKNMFKYEHKIYNEIMTDCADDFSELSLHNEIISKMQHYGAPTRLLDITTNPLVALYFACCNELDKDGTVNIKKKKKSDIKKYDSDSISILSCLPRFTYQEKQKMKKLAKKYKSNKEGKKYKKSEINFFNEERIILRLLHEIKKEKPAFENIINPDDLLKNYFFVPRKNNARIIKQGGAFIILILIVPVL